MSSQKGKLFLEFDDDQQDVQQSSPTPQKSYKTDAYKRVDEQTDKFSGNKIGKGYFNQNDDTDFIEVTSPQKKDNLQVQTNNSNMRPDRRRKNKKNQSLKPLSQAIKTQTKSISLPTQLEKHKNSLKVIQDGQNNEQEQIEEITFGGHKIEQQKCLFELRKVQQDQQVISQQQEIENQSKTQQRKQRMRPPKVQINRNQTEKKVGSGSEHDSPEPLRNNKSNTGSLVSPNQMIQFVTKVLPPQRTVRLTLYRVKGLLQIHTCYNLHASQDNRYLLTAKKVSNSLIATHHISMNQNDMQENGPAYVGKVKSSLTGTSNNIYGPGLSPENAKGNNGPQREVLATVVYLTDMFTSSSKPRQFRVYLKRPEVSYFQLSGVTPYQDQVSLQDLYPLNKSKIQVFRNRKPVWKQQIKGYSLNFRGRVSQPSIKNFILQTNTEQQEGQQVLLFGRVADDKFNMDVSGPLNLTIALGIVITSFGSA